MSEIAFQAYKFGSLSAVGPSTAITPYRLDNMEIRLRALVAERIESAGWAVRAESYLTCRKDMIVYRCLMNHDKKFPMSCKQPFCDLCGNWQRQKTLDKYVLIASKVRNLKLITLTLPYLAKIDTKTIRRWLSKVRYFLKFTLKCAGGVFVPELVRKEPEAAWYLHFHAVVSMKYMNKVDLIGAWARYTGISHMADIEGVRNRTKAVAYIMKYLSKKPSGLECLGLSTKADALATLMLSFFEVKKVRLFGCFVGAFENEVVVAFLLMCGECPTETVMYWDGVESGIH